jgi:hypothetical protein
LLKWIEDGYDDYGGESVIVVAFHDWRVTPCSFGRSLPAFAMNDLRGGSCLNQERP